MLLSEDRILEYQYDCIYQALSLANGNEYKIRKVCDGVYEFGQMPHEDFLNGWKLPKLKNLKHYGLCDNYNQIIEKEPELLSKYSAYLIILVPVKSKYQKFFKYRRYGEYLSSKEIISEDFGDSGVDCVYAYKILKKDL